MPPLSPSGTPVYMSPELINSNRASDKGRAGTRAGWRAGGGACARAQAGACTAVWARAPPVPATVKPTAVVTHATHTPLNYPQPPPQPPFPLPSRYDGALADVWASGILLIVMLLGTFPFDHVEHPDPNTSEAHLEVWLQQVRQPWSGMPHIKHAVEKLTPECMDLMNRIFIIDEKK